MLWVLQAKTSGISKDHSKTDVSVGFRQPYFCPWRGHKYGVSIQSFIDLGKTFFRESRIWNIAQTLFLASFFIFIFFHFPDSRLSVVKGFRLCFWWRDSETTKLLLFDFDFVRFCYLIIINKFLFFVTLISFDSNINRWIKSIDTGIINYWLLLIFINLYMSGIPWQA